MGVSSGYFSVRPGAAYCCEPLLSSPFFQIDAAPIGVRSIATGALELGLKTSLTFSRFRTDEQPRYGPSVVSFGVWATYLFLPEADP